MQLNFELSRYTIARELYTVAILSFKSAGRAKRGRISQHNVVRSKPTYTRASWNGGKAFEPAIHPSYVWH